MTYPRQMGRGRGVVGASLLLLALAGCSGSSDPGPSGPRETGSPAVDLQVRGVVEFVSPDSTTEPPPLTCDGQDGPIADCVAANHGEEHLVLVGPEPDGGTFVLGPVIVDGSDVLAANVLPPPTSGLGWAVAIQLTPAGASAFAEETGASVGDRIAMVVDGQVVSAPTVAVPITSGAIHIGGSFAEAEADALASSFTPTSAGT